MEPIKTASTLERIIRNGILTVMVAGFGIAFLMDGYGGYALKNLENAKIELPIEYRDQARISSKVVRSRLDLVKQGKRLKDLEEEFGEACWKGMREGSKKSEAIWFGPGGMLAVSYNASGIVNTVPIWKDGRYSEVDIMTQRWLGYVLAPLGFILILRLIAMAVRGATLSDEGLRPSGGPLIPYEAMTGWDTADFEKKGRINLTYVLNGREGTYTLDEYTLKAFPLIVQEICNRNSNFDNPLVKDKENSSGDHEPDTVE